MHRAVNLGIAVDLDFEGLVVPVVHDADGLRLRALARAITDVATRARARQLVPDDLAGGTFTVTNPGASGTWISFPIINQPQVAILSTDGVSKQVVVDERGRLGDRHRSASCASRSTTARIDGAYAGAFLARVQEIVETRDWASGALTRACADPRCRSSGSSDGRSPGCTAPASRRGSPRCSGENARFGSS